MALNSYSTALDSFKDTLFLVFSLFLLTLMIVMSITQEEKNERVSEFSVNRHSNSSEQARERGTLVGKVTVSPNTFTHEGQEIVINEAWIEEVKKTEHAFVWFSYEKNIGYVLRFNLSEGQKVFEDSDNRIQFEAPEIETTFATLNDGEIFSSGVSNSSIRKLNLKLRNKRAVQSAPTAQPVEGEDPAPPAEAEEVSEQAVRA